MKRHPELFKRFVLARRTEETAKRLASAAGLLCHRRMIPAVRTSAQVDGGGNG